ncbi:hypothetical protein IC575_029108 [Cucumis melo]|uniref:15d_03-C10-like protein n=1 Tax=Cucumis melo TaxID=3656 RepID=A5Y730_CUCME|nr:15d_03-C10-like protein [Cucumis melo]
MFSSLFHAQLLSNHAVSCTSLEFTKRCFIPPRNMRLLGENDVIGWELGQFLPTLLVELQTTPKSMEWNSVMSQDVFCFSLQYDLVGFSVLCHEFWWASSPKGI